MAPVSAAGGVDARGAECCELWGRHSTLPPPPLGPIAECVLGEGDLHRREGRRAVERGDGGGGRVQSGRAPVAAAGRWAIVVIQCAGGRSLGHGGVRVWTVKGGRGVRQAGPSEVTVLVGGGLVLGPGVCGRSGNGGDWDVAAIIAAGGPGDSQERAGASQLTPLHFSGRSLRLNRSLLFPTAHPDGI